MRRGLLGFFLLPLFFTLACGVKGDPQPYFHSTPQEEDAYTEARKREDASEEETPQSTVEESESSSGKSSR